MVILVIKRVIRLHLLQLLVVRVKLMETIAVLPRPDLIISKLRFKEC